MQFWRDTHENGT